jgi:hypothetical protein
MSQELINIGALPNDGEGDPLRTAFQKINNNFTQLFGTTFNTSLGYSTGNTANQVIFETPVETFTQATFQINTTNPSNQDSQDITLNASIQNNGSNVKFVGHSTLFYGNALTNFDMVIADSNVQILVNPAVNANLVHFIASQITFNGGGEDSYSIQYNNQNPGNSMGTQGGQLISTQGI